MRANEGTLSNQIQGRVGDGVKDRQFNFFFRRERVDGGVFEEQFKIQNGRRG